LPPAAVSAAPGSRPTPAAAPSSSPIVAGNPGDRYQIQVASFRTVQRAAQVSSGLEAAGLTVEMRNNAAGGWYHLTVGPFPTVEEASAAQRTLVREGFAETFVVVVPGK
jgi:cell division protein FtsN